MTTRALALLLSCTGEPAQRDGLVPAGPEPAASPEPAALPSTLVAVVPVAPSRVGHTPTPQPMTDWVRSTRERLAKVVADHGRDPYNPWAVGHALLALGRDVRLTNDRDAIPWLFSEYAEVVDVGGAPSLEFATKRGSIRIEPHTDLLLKSFTEAGLAPDAVVVVGDRPFHASDLYRASMARTWVDGEKTSFQSWNDTPWALQGLAAWSPPEAAWTADGHAMTLDAFTHAVVVQLSKETAFIREARKRGEDVQKRGQGIFAYTCGGAHLLQGAAYAVARGFGEPGDREALDAEIEVLYWRLGFELGVVDDALAQAPEYKVVLLEQRLKFLGHFLETAHKLAALGLYTPDIEQQLLLEKALEELLLTVSHIEDLGVFERLDEIRAMNEQTYLDYVGDSAHAVRGIDLATGQGTIDY